jgi:hypothetical protein
MVRQLDLGTHPVDFQIAVVQVSRGHFCFVADKHQHIYGFFMAPIGSCSK